MLDRCVLIGRWESEHPTIIDAICGHQTCPGPRHERFSTHSIRLGCLIGTQKTSLSESGAMIFQLVIASEGDHACRRKRQPFVGVPSTLVELLSGLSIGEIREQLIDQRKQLWGAAPSTADRHRESLGGSSLEANVSCDHLLLFEESYVFQEQADHAFTVPIRGALIIPHPRKI